MGQVEVVFREALNMAVMIEPLVKGCLRFLDLALVPAPVCVCWKYYELRAKELVLPFPSVHPKVIK